MSQSKPFFPALTFLLMILAASFVNAQPLKRQSLKVHNLNIATNLSGSGLIVFKSNLMEINRTIDLGHNVQILNNYPRVFITSFPVGVTVDGGTNGYYPFILNAAITNPRRISLPKYLRPYLTYSVSVPVQITGNLRLVNRTTGTVISESTVNLSGIGTYKFLSVGQENAPASYLFTDSSFSLSESSPQNLNGQPLDQLLLLFPRANDNYFDF